MSVVAGKVSPFEPRAGTAMNAGLLRTHYELFGIEPGYDLDREALAAVHLELQKAVHPDRYAAATPLEKRLAVQRAAQVNEAYRTLKDPVERARYLLSLHGIDTEEETNTAMSPAFLMEQMEWRERLDEVPNSGNPMATLLELAGKLEQTQRGMYRQLGEFFLQGDDPAYRNAAELVRELRFLQRLQQQVADLEERFL